MFVQNNMTGNLRINLTKDESKPVEKHVKNKLDSSAITHSVHYPNDYNSK